MSMRYLLYWRNGYTVRRNRIDHTFTEKLAGKVCQPKFKINSSWSDYGFVSTSSIKPRRYGFAVPRRIAL